VRVEVRVPAADIGVPDADTGAPDADTEALAGGIQVGPWHAGVGESVRAGRLLVELVTDKAAFELEAPGTGTLVEIRAERGATVGPGEVLAVIETDRAGGDGP